jgi:RNA polymerase sigma factor (sigma-70 family)
MNVKSESMKEEGLRKKIEKVVWDCRRAIVLSTEALSMGEPPITRASLLVRIRDVHDGEAWSRFVVVYGPMVYDYGRRHGLQDADAADLTQEVLRTVAGSAGRFAYDPSRGTFRSWLFTVARTRRLDLDARRARQPVGSGEPTVADRLESVPNRDIESDEEVWRREYKQRLFNWASEQARNEFQESTWQAFWRTAVGGASPRDVAGELGLSIGAVYMAKSRVLMRLRELIEQVRCDDDL